MTALLENEPGDVLWLEGSRAARILGYFGIPTGGVPFVSAADAERALLEVRSDPSFGPLLRILRKGKEPVLRITPLTDQDIREVAGGGGDSDRLRRRGAARADLAGHRGDAVALGDVG